MGSAIFTHILNIDVENRYFGCHQSAINNSKLSSLLKTMSNMQWYPAINEQELVPLGQQWRLSFCFLFQMAGLVSCALLLVVLLAIGPYFKTLPNVGRKIVWKLKNHIYYTTHRLHRYLLQRKFDES